MLCDTLVTSAKLLIGQCRDKAKMLDEGIKIPVAVEQLETARRKCKATFDAARGDHGTDGLVGSQVC